MFPKKDRIVNALVGKEWKNVDDAFYGMAPNGPLQGTYWYISTMAIGSQPKSSIMIPRIPFPYKINGVKMSGWGHGRNRFDVGFAMWTFENGKFRDNFIEPAQAELGEKSLSVKSKNGYNLEMKGSGVNYEVLVSGGNEKILQAKSRGSDFKEEPFVVAPGFVPTIAKHSRDSMAAAGLYFQKPLFMVRHFDLSTRLNGKYADKKINGSLWFERLNSFATYFPWKFIFLNFEKDVYIAIAWYYGKIDLNTKPRVHIYFLRDKRSRKGFHLNLEKYVYRASENGEEFLDFRNDAKFIDISGRNKEASIRLKLEFLDTHKYEFEVMNSLGIYWQFFFKIKELVVKIGNKELRLKDFGKYCAYGEHSYFKKILGVEKKKNI